MESNDSSLEMHHTFLSLSVGNDDFSSMVNDNVELLDVFMLYT